MINPKIKVGIRHFKSEVKIIRSEPISFISGLKDIIDNVLGLSKENKKIYEQRIQFKIDTEGNIYQIIISDSIEHGFKDIDKNEEKNPLNMGHMRAAHTIDNTTSEFGVGMKKTFIFTSHKTTVYTKCVNENGTNYYKIEFDFRDMCSREEAINSYEPNLFEPITQEQFLNKKPDDIGSVIILEELIPSSLGNLKLKEEDDRNSFLNGIKNELGVTYRDVINKHINIYVNDNKVEPSRDMKQVDEKQTFDLFVQLDDNKEPKNMYYHNHKTNTWFSFDKNKKDLFSRIPVDTVKNKITKDFYTIKVFFCDDYNNGEGDSNLNAMSEMVRDGRSFGKIKITKTEKDGYSNYIYSRVEWDSKTLNGLFGVSSSKTIVKRDGDLYSALACILKKPENESRKKRKLEAKKRKEEEKNKSDEEEDYEDEEETNVIVDDDEDIPAIPVKENKKVSKKDEIDIQTVKKSNVEEVVEEVEEEVEEDVEEVVKEEEDVEVDIEIDVEIEEVDVKEQSTVEVKEEQQSTVEVKEEQQPTVEVKEQQPIVEVKEQQPTVEVKEQQPTVEVKEQQPTVEVKEQQSTVEVKEEQQPTVEVKEEQQPTVEVKEEQQSTVEVKEETINDPYKELINRIIDCVNTDKFKKIIDNISREIPYEKLKEILTQQ
jgi:hypothetical protein